MTYMLKDLPHATDEGLLVDRVQSLQGGGVALVLHYGQLLYISTKHIQDRSGPGVHISKIPPPPQGGKNISRCYSGEKYA